MKAELIRWAKVVSVSEIKKGERVLDLGCGKMMLKRFLPQVRYTGIDISGNKGIIKWDLEKGLPATIRKRRFDVIFMNEFLEHIENFKSLLIQCRKVLAANGRIVISTPSPSRFIFREEPTHIHCFRKTNMANLARICGLKVTRIVGSYIRIPVLHLFIPTSQTLYSDVLIYKLERLK
jgi:2-polyprenyl-3-methyl-5-hydroxy-6-metoxy-1,4-benzoquinol methylase